MKKLSVQARCRSGSERATGTLQSVPVLLSSALVTVCCFSPVVLAAPTGGTVVGGEGTIQQTSNTSTLISQTSQSLAINWDTFNIGADESVRFNQPSSSSVVLNRIVGENPSEIFGHLDANGRVFLINPNGILFGQSAMINVGSLFASSLDIDPQRFMQGDYSFAAAQGQTPGIIVNQGMIQAATGGSVSLVGGAVSNQGVIVANLGQVNLAAGRKSVIDFDGDGLIRFEVSDDVVNNTHALDTAVNNSGEIHADGGTVLMKGVVAADVFSQAVNNDGVIKATRIENKGGVIRLVGSNAPVVNSGTLDVSGQGANSTGGTVEILGDSVALNEGSTINASGDAGGGTVLVGGDAHGSNPDIKNATQTRVSDNTTINADANVNGDGGKVVVWSDDSTEFYGDISARGGAEGGDGGFVEISGKQYLTIPLAQVTIDTLAPMGNAGLLLLDPGTVTICHTLDAGCTPSGTNVFDDAGINTTLGTTSLDIKTADATNNGTEDINVTGTVAISWGNKNFSLTAGNDINVASGASFNWTGNADFTLTSNTHDINLNGIISGGNASANLFLNFANTLNLGDVDVSGTTAVKATGGGNSTIVGQDIDTTWTVDGVNSALNNTKGTIGFSGVGTLTGGIGNDTFKLKSGSVNAVNGGTGSDTIDLSGNSGTVSVNLQTSAATGASSFSGIESFIGNGTDATLTGQDSGVTFGVTSQNAGTVSGVSFSGFNNLTGGSGVDTFNLGADVTGTVDGGGGADIFNVTTALTGSLNGNTGNDTFNLGADVSGTVDGGGNDDTFNVTTAISSALTGNTGNDTFNIGANESGTVNGDAGNDTFNITAAVTVSNPLDGGAGNDSFVFTSGGSLAGTIAGGADTDTIDLSSKTGAINVSLADSSVTNVNGGAGGGFATIEAIKGGTGSNAVTGTSGGNTWAISGADTVTVSGGTLSSGVTLTNFSTLTGGSGNDSFQFGSSGSISGTINGGGGTDTLDYSTAAGKAFTVNLANDSATALYGGAAGGFISIEAVKGGGGDDILIGGNSGNNWSINSADTGSVSGFGFTDMSNLVAGSGGDTFQFGSTGSLSGTVTGGAGNDTLNFANVSTAVTVNLANNSASVINGGANSGISSIENVVGDGSNDSLVGGNAGNTWSITGADDGSVGGINFTNMSHLVAGSGGDTFQFAIGSSISGSIAGGSGTDTLDFSATGSAVTVNLANASATLIKSGAAGGISGIDAVIGGGGNDTLIGANSGNTWSITGTDSGSVGSVSFTDFSNLTAGSGGDTFHFASGSSISGKVSGGAGSDTLNFADTASAVTVDLSNNSATPVNGGSASGFSSIETVTGGGGDDTLVGSNSGNTWSLTGVDAGSVAGVTFTGMSNLTAGTGGDTFHFASGSSVTGTVTGASGSDTLDFADAATAVTVDLANTSATLIKSGASGGFSGIETFLGGGADDTLIAPDANNTWSMSANDIGTVSGVGFSGFHNLQGGSLNDNFILDYNGASTRSLSIDGKAGVNNVTLTGGGSTADGTYNPGSANSGSVSYSQNSHTETLALSQVNGLVDNRTANKLTVNGSSGNDSITLSGGSIGFSSLLNIAYANKTNLTLNGGAGSDTVDVTGAISLPGTLEINAENITDSSGQTVSADTLSINGATSVGASAARLITDIGNLQLTGIGGSVYISEASGLNILASDIGGNLVLTTAGAVAQTGALKVAGSTDIASGSNAITLDNANNDFGGAVTLTNSGTSNVTLNDANTMTVGKITSGGDVTATTQNGNLYLGKVYTSGAVTLTVNNGNLLGDNSTQIDPNIKASTLTITVPDGGIGGLTNQIAVNVTNSTTLFSQQTQAFLTGPTGTLTSGTNLVINTSDIQGTAGRGQNLVVGNIYFIDPALFSQEFSLFNITDNGIRLPPDQIEEQ